MRIERDVAVKLRDGPCIYVDIYRPENVANVPVMISWSPYGKHLSGVSQYANIPDDNMAKGCGVDPAWLSPYAGFEGPDPVPWTSAGYAVISVNPRAMWWSEGEFASIWGEREARDVCDLIEWAGTQDWSSGKVGMSGVSYLATIQWWAASLQPKHLAAINPCEGQIDPYREFIFHGGIPDTNFPSFWQHNRLKISTSKVEAMYDMGTKHPLDDEYWASKRMDLSKIEVPAFVIASWSDQGLHTRGTLEAFEKIASKHKYLEVHGRKKWAYFHQPSTFERQRAFFDRYLMGKEDAIVSWPLVRYELRTGYYEGIDCMSKAWPLSSLKLKTLHLDAADKTLKYDKPNTVSSVRYEAGTQGGEVVFEHVFDTQTDIIGGAGLTVWITAEDAEDTDIFVGLRKLDSAGKPVHFPFSNSLERGPVALGWLRASHRELDHAKSTPDRPWHPHTAEKPLVRGEPTAVEIEIWPSATRFEEGERLQLVIRGSDLYTMMTPSRHLQSRNSGAHVITTGAGYDSRLVINVAESLLG